MKVSIVTISYNQAEFLERCLLSVLDQDYPDLEYIVIDPGSTDGSRNIIEKYRDRINSVIYEKDNGPADGLNKGFSHATGDILGFLNSDDILYPGALTEVVETFRTNTDIDVVSGNAYAINEHDENIRKCYSDRYSRFSYAYGTGVLIQQSTFFTRDIYNKTAGFNVNNRCAWDGELYLDMSLAGARFHRVNRIWSGFRMHGESITVSNKMLDRILEYQQRIFHKVMGRKKSVRDIPIQFCMKMLKHATNLEGAIERFKKGPVTGRRK